MSTFEAFEKYDFDNDAQFQVSGFIKQPPFFIFFLLNSKL
jgi:hypothetical protein